MNLRSSITSMNRGRLSRMVAALVVSSVLSGSDLTLTRLRAEEPAAIEFFEKEIRPLLVERCQPCHNAKKSSGGLKLTDQASILKGGDSGPAVVPGKADESLLIQAV